MNAMEITARQDGSELDEYRGLDVETLPRRPDNSYVQEMIAKSKAMYRERLAKAVCTRRKR